MSRLLDDLRAVVQAVIPTSPYWVPRKFRIVAMNVGDNRVQLQSVVKGLGFPDILPISIAPGMAGLKAKLTPGAIVIVQFVDGDPAQPIITHFASADEQGFVPVELSLDATDTVAVGPSATVVELAGGDELTNDWISRPIRYGDKLLIPSLGVSGVATTPVEITCIPLVTPASVCKVKA